MDNESKFREEGVWERAESFSFSCREFDSSAINFFADDRSSSSDESFIEIALEPAPIHNIDDRVNRESEMEVELRVSFSSSFQLRESVTKGLLNPEGFKINGGGSTETFTLSSSSSSTSTSRSAFNRFSTEAKFWSAPLSRSPSKFHKTLKRKLRFPNINRFLEPFMPNSQNSSGIQEKSVASSSNVFTEEIHRKQEELVQGREMPNIKNRGILMKFFTKMKSKKIEAILASLMKPQQFSSEVGKKKKRSEEILQRNRSQVTPWERNLVRVEQGKNRGFEMNWDSIRQVMEAVGTSLGRNDQRRTRSCPISRNSSPIHNNSESKMMCAGDSSIQAAIAHCKRSFGQSSDFQF